MRDIEGSCDTPSKRNSPHRKLLKRVLKNFDEDAEVYLLTIYGLWQWGGVGWGGTPLPLRVFDHGQHKLELVDLGGDHKKGKVDLGEIGSGCDGLHYMKFPNNKNIMLRRKRQWTNTWSGKPACDGQKWEMKAE